MKGPTILVVENDEGVLRAVRRLIRSRFSRVGVARSFPEAAEILADETFSVVLVDYDLGEGGTGAKVLDLVAERSPETRRVLYTGATTVQQGQSRAHAVVQKPMFPDELIAALLPGR